MNYLFLGMVSSFACGRLLNRLIVIQDMHLDWLKYFVFLLIILILFQSMRSAVSKILLAGACAAFFVWGLINNDNWVMQGGWPICDIWLDHIRTQLVARIATLPPHLQGIMAGIIIGDKTGLAYPIQRLFRDLGIIHLLCISGFHVSLFSGFISAILKTPVTIFYSVRLCSHGFKEVVSGATKKITVVVCFLYGRMIAFPAGAQRAVLLLVCHTFIEACGLKSGRTALYTMTLGLQILLFPVDVLTCASLLSWACYLIVVDHAGRPASGRTFARSVLMIGHMQLRLLATCSVILGVVTPAAVIVNVLVIPLFPFLMFGGLYLLVFQEGLISSWFLSNFTEMYGIMSQFGNYMGHISWLSIPLLQLNLLIQFFLVSLFMQTFLSLYTKLSIREKAC